MNGWHAAGAADDLARAIYKARCQYYGVQEWAWSDVPFICRSQFTELAVQMLEGLALPTPDVARMDLKRSKVIATISEAEPWGRMS